MLNHLTDMKEAFLHTVLLDLQKAYCTLEHDRLRGGRHKEGGSRGTGRDPASLHPRKGEGRIAADVVVNLGI